MGCLLWVFSGRMTVWFLQIDGLMQERRNSSALAMELCLSCIYPSRWGLTVCHKFCWWLDPFCHQVKLVQHTYSCLFGSFLCNSAQEREKEAIQLETCSVWALLKLTNSKFRNYLYTPNAMQVRLVRDGKRAGCVVSNSFNLMNGHRDNSVWSLI